MKEWKQKSQKILKKVGVLFLLVGVLGVVALPATTAYANEYDFLLDGSGNASIDAVTEVAEGLGSSGYRLARTVAIGVIFCSLVIAFASLGVVKNSQKREDNKSWVFWLCLSIAGISGVFVIFSFISGFF